MSTFAGSPVWASVITIVGTMVFGLVTMMFRLIGKVNTIGNKVDSIAEDIVEIKDDADIMRYSDVARRGSKGRRNVR